MLTFYGLAIGMKNLEIYLNTINLFNSKLNFTVEIENNNRIFP